MYRPNAPQVLLKKAVLRTVPGQAPGNEAPLRLKDRPPSPLVAVDPLPFFSCMAFFQSKPPKILH